MAKSPEPINIFSYRIDVAGVAAALRSVAAEVTLDGPDDAWREAVALGPKSLFWKRSRLLITHSPDYYSGPDWPQQIAGMVGYFTPFPESPHKKTVMQAIRSFRFSLAFPEFDLDIESNDPRVAWVHAICQKLDGVIFTPSGLRDSRGRLLVSAYSDVDPDAQPPFVPVQPILTVNIDPNAPVDEDDSDDDDEPPTAERVAKRALVLAAVGNRGLIENERENFDNVEETRAGILKWLQAAGASEELEPDEWKVLQRPVGSLDQQAAICSCWRLEGLAVLLWSLGRLELPAYDQTAAPADLFDAACLFDDDGARQFIANARLRPPAELNAYELFVLMVHWRLTEFSLRPQAMDFVAFSKKSWRGSFDLTPFRLIDGDLAIGDRPIADADRSLYGTCRSIAMERHLAINWLLGDSVIYSETDVGT